MLSARFNVERGDGEFYIVSAVDYAGITFSLVPTHNQFEIVNCSLALAVLGEALGLPVEQMPVFNISEVTSGIELTCNLSGNILTSLKFKIFGKEYNADSLNLPLTAVVSAVGRFLAAIGINQVHHPIDSAHGVTMHGNESDILIRFAVSIYTIKIVFTKTNGSYRIE